MRTEEGGKREGSSNIESKGRRKKKRLRIMTKQRKLEEGWD